VLYVGASEIVAGRMSVGSFFTYTVLLGFLVAPLVQVATIGSQLSEALAGLDRTRELLRERREDDDARRSVELADVGGRVAFEDVGFAYREGEPVLEGIALVAEAGTVTALVGPSGAGKSTLIGLVCAFHAPSSGRVLVDGIDLATVKLDSYRSKLGVVLQETFLFDGSIRDNVAFSRPEASDAQIREACRIAHVGEFAEAFPDGYDTVVGERGVRLSGGQRQRVAIARAILAEPRILILDEATSSLDSESEALIQEGLGWLMKGRTTFVIAHRLSTIRRADQILVIEKGRIVERGTHAQLYASGGRYREMYDRQHGVETNLFLAPGEGGEAFEPEAEEPAAAAASAAPAARLGLIDP
jgi:subfamily B ATP-binding cassette protein MsbA